MSLLDDVSIVVTPNGYKAGELYAVIPVPTLGAELGDTGTIDDNAGGVITQTSSLNYNATSDGTSTSVTRPRINNFTVTAGKRYRITITPSNQSGTIQFSINNDGTYLAQDNDLSSNLEFDFTNGSNLRMFFDGTETFNCDFIISLKELTSADMDVTRETAATRVDEDGLVNYAEVLGGEEVTCGDFSCAVPTDSWTEGTGWSFGESTADAEDAAYGSALVSDNTLLAGIKYKVSFEVSNYIKGSFRVYVGNTYSSDVSSNGSFTFFLTSANTNAFKAQTRSGGSGTTLSISNISVKEAVLDNVPRIDYTGGGCPHILAEPQRTNEVTYSEDFSQWTLSDITLGSDGVSPSGQTNANLIQTGTSGGDQVSETFTLLATNTTTYSVFIKRVGGAEWVDFLLVKLGFSHSVKVWFNINTGAVGSNLQTGTTTLDNASVESFGNNWYKLNVTTTDTTNNTSFNIRVRTASADGSDTRVNDSSYYLWGMQLEEGSYATSYIPTSGSTVTRNQDIFTRDGISSLINSPEGVLFTEIAALSDDGTSRDISVSDGTSANYARISLSNAVGNIEYNVVVGSSTKASGTSAITQTNFNKIAVKWKVNDFALWVNGSEVLSQLSGTSFSASTLTTLNFDRGSGTNYFFGKVKQLQVYTTALTDVQLAALTT